MFCPSSLGIFLLRRGEVKSSVERQLVVKTITWWPCFSRKSPILEMTLEPPSIAGGKMWVTSKNLAIVDIVYFIYS